MTTVLVVEDEEPILALLSALLGDEGYRVVTARNGREGLDCLAVVQPDAVLCDVMMPVIDGATLCRHVQSDPAYRSIPVVLMSAAPPPLASSAGRYAAFLAKPFTLDAVLDVLERVIRRRGARHISADPDLPGTGIAWVQAEASMRRDSAAGAALSRARSADIARVLEGVGACS